MFDKKTKEPLKQAPQKPLSEQKQTLETEIADLQSQIRDIENVPCDTVLFAFLKSQGINYRAKLEEINQNLLQNKAKLEQLQRQKEAIRLKLEKEALSTPAPACFNSAEAARHIKEGNESFTVGRAYNGA